MALAPLEVHSDVQPHVHSVWRGPEEGQSTEVGQVSLYQYKQAEEIQRAFDPSVETLVMAAVLKADPINLMKIERCWPGLVEEWRYRFQSGGGLLPHEAGYDPEMDDNIRIQAEAVLREEA
jgi:hypothetical protein